MKFAVPEKLKALSGLLTASLYVVGGACRDFLGALERADGEKKDWDICSPTLAEEVACAAEKCGFTVTATYKNTGTVRMCADGEEYEFTSFRTDRYVRGMHSPAEVFFTDDMVLDARRRDFKCNAVYYSVTEEKFCDPLGGIADIENRVISTVAPPEKVFGEDGLRLMRLCRIAAETGFTPTEECLEGARVNAELIRDIAVERIWAELNYILHADAKYGVAGAQYAGLKLLDKTGVLDIILPELTLGRGMEQRSDFHSYDVLEHSLRCVLYAPPGVRLAALLHDVGKPISKLQTGRFAGHEVTGCEEAEKILSRFKVGKKLSAQVCGLVRWHMYDLSGETSVNKIKKFIVSHGDIYGDLLLLKQADYSACKDDLSVAPCILRWESIRKDMQTEGVPLTLKQLAVKGDKLIGAGISPDETGKTLNFLLGECVVGNVRNEEESLIRLALAHTGKKCKY